MAQTFLETGQHGFFIPSFNIDDTAGCQTCLGDCRRKKILPGDAPKHLALGASDNARGKERRGRAVDGPVTAACYFMQRTRCEPAAR
jgi:hypothetical protein